jgi:hypothetical protein
VIPTWYIEWTARHAKKFNYNSEGRDAILSWADEFASIYTTEELHRATAALVLDPQCPRFANEQRGLIIDAIVSDRVIANRRRRAAEVSDYTCERQCHRGVLIVCTTASLGRACAARGLHAVRLSKRESVSDDKREQGPGCTPGAILIEPTQEGPHRSGRYNYPAQSRTGESHGISVH